MSRTHSPDEVLTPQKIVIVAKKVHDFLLANEIDDDDLCRLWYLPKHTDVYTYLKECLELHTYADVPHLDAMIADNALGDVLTTFISDNDGGASMSEDAQLLGELFDRHNDTGLTFDETVTLDRLLTEYGLRELVITEPVEPLETEQPTSKSVKDTIAEGCKRIKEQCTSTQRQIPKLKLTMDDMDPGKLMRESPLLDFASRGLNTAPKWSDAS